MIIDTLLELTSKHPAIGFWQSYYRIRSMGHRWNHKRVYRVYTALKLNIRRRAKKRLPARAKQQLFQPEGVDQVWSLDFMHDSLWDGRSFRMLNMMDDYNRHEPAGFARDPCIGSAQRKPWAAWNDPRR